MPYYHNTISRANFFRDIQIWPLSRYLDYKGWLNNFTEGEERNIACKILDFFMFYPKSFIDNMLISSIGYTGHIIKEKYENWEHSNFYDKCIYSFIPGEIPNITDSGGIFARKLRGVLSINNSQIIDFKDLHTYLLNDETPTSPVILVDDFVGSGIQCNKAWSSNSNNPTGKTLSEISKLKNHRFIYAPLMANKKGVDYISKYCDNLTLSAVHVLGDEYNLFNENCSCWEGDKELYDKGTRLIYHKSLLLGIPDEGEKSIFGFEKQGLAIAFEHGIPDAVPAFFYHTADNWTPLISKRYD